MFIPEKAKEERYVQHSYKRRQLIGEIVSMWYVWVFVGALLYFAVR